jgi:polysaccharide biosynthesis protein PslG
MATPASVQGARIRWETSSHVSNVVLFLGLLVATLAAIGEFTPSWNVAASGKTSLAVPGPASDANEIPPMVFGMHIMDPYESKPWPNVPVNALGKGARTLWSYIEPSKSVYDWSRLDAYVKLAQANGVKMMQSAEGVPEWAAADASTCHIPFAGAPPKCSGMVRNIQDWDEFVTAMVTRYKGRITAYELWNEPNNDTKITTTDMVTLTRHFHDKVRALDPNALIISPSYTVGKDLDAYFAAGGTRDVDAVSFHAYPDSRGDAELIVRSWTSSVREVMAKYGLSAKPLWNTEASWGGGVADSDLQAAFIARYYLLSWFRKIDRTYWYGWDNRKEGTLYIPGQPPTKPAIAYQQVYNWILGGSAPRCTASSGYGKNGDFIYGDSFYTLAFTNGHGLPAQVVWRTSSHSTLTSAYTIPSQFTQYQDLDGNTFHAPVNRRLDVGNKPILLE